MDEHYRGPQFLLRAALYVCMNPSQDRRIMEVGVYILWLASDFLAMKADDLAARKNRRFPPKSSENDAATQTKRKERHGKRNEHINE